MAKQIPIGTRGEAREGVEFKHTLAAHHPELPAVYSTPDMIRLMETAAFLACKDGKTFSGEALRAAVGVGRRAALAPISGPRPNWSRLTGASMRFA